MIRYRQGLILLAVALVTNVTAQTQKEASPGITACREHKYFTAARYWEDRRAAGDKIGSADQTLLGCAYANMAILADKAYSVECRLVADYSGFYQTHRNGDISMLRGLALFGGGNWTEAQKEFERIPIGDKLKPQADFWSQVSRSKQNVAGDQFKEPKSLPADIAMAHWILDKQNYPEIPAIKSGSWNAHLTALNQLKNGDLSAAQAILLDKLGQPKTIPLASRDSVVLYQPIDLLVARSVYCQLGQRELESVVQAGQADDNARYFLGYLYYLQGQYPLAEEQFRKIGKSDLGTIAQVYIAEGWNQSGKSDPARGKWEELLKSKVEYARGEAAWFLYRSGIAPEKGKNALLELCRRPHVKGESRPKVDQQCYLNLAQIYMADEDYETALRYLYDGYSREGSTLDNRLDFLIACVECQYLRGVIEYQNCQEILYFLQKEYPFLRPLHQTMASIYARSLKGKPLGDVKGQ